MISDESAKEILRNIELTGNTNTTIRPIIGGNLERIITKSSGLPKIQTNVTSKFKLILETPGNLRSFNPFEIRCCLCNKVVSYPCWYFDIKYAVNWFHYFVCFDGNSPEKVNCKCYRR